MSDFYRQYHLTFNQLLGALVITDNAGNTIEHNEGFDRLCTLSASIKKSGATQYFCGNGASSAIASHMAIDWSKNGKVSTRVFTDAALLSAVVNDLGAEHMYSAPLAYYARPGDILVTISSSGNSENIIHVIHKARELGLDVITFSGLKPDNQSRGLGDLNFYIPAKTYGMVECAHQVLMHVWLDKYMGINIWDRDEYQNMRQDHYQS